MIGKWCGAICLLGLCLVFIGTYADAQATYAFILTKDLPQSQAILTGFRKSFPDAKVISLDLQGKEDSRQVKDLVQKTRPAMLICLGSGATTSAIEASTGIPILFAMVINYQRYPQFHNADVTGVSMEIPPASLFTQFRMLLPDVTSLGVPYNPSVSSEIVATAQIAAQQIGMRLVPIPVEQPQKLTKLLTDNNSRYAGLWMLADTKLYNRETSALNDLIQFAQRQKKPILAFSEAFLKSGAFFSISIDYHSVGSQLAMIAKRIIEDRVEPSDIPVSPPIGTYTVLNREVAKVLLGDAFHEEIYDKVDTVYPELEE